MKPFTDQTMNALRNHHSLAESVKDKKEIEHLKRVIAGYKAYFTKRRKQK